MTTPVPKWLALADHFNICNWLKKLSTGEWTIWYLQAGHVTDVAEREHGVPQSYWKHSIDHSCPGRVVQRIKSEKVDLVESRQFHVKKPVLWNSHCCPHCCKEGHVPTIKVKHRYLMCSAVLPGWLGGGCIGKHEQWAWGFHMHNLGAVGTQYRIIMDPWWAWVMQRREQLVTGCFFTGTPPKKLKYGKPRLGKGAQKKPERVKNGLKMAKKHIEILYFS